MLCRVGYTLALTCGGCTFGSHGPGEGSAATFGSRGDVDTAPATDTSEGMDTGSTAPASASSSPETGGTSSSSEAGDGPILTGGVTLTDGDPPVDPADLDPYGPCGAGCTIPGSQCTDHGACASPCLVDRACPPPLSGTAKPQCNSPFWDYCDLPCDPQTTCPDGMQCLQHQFGMSCGWP